MHYQTYVAGVEKRRMLLQQKLQQANALRLEAQLPLRNVDQTVMKMEPLMSQREFDARGKAQRGFARFRKQQLRTIDLPQPDTAANWQQHKALAFRQAFVEHQIQRAWQNQGTPSL